MHDYQTQIRKARLRDWQQPAYCRKTVAIIFAITLASWVAGTLVAL